MTLLRKKTDHELIHQFRDGDLHALKALIIRHKDKLYTSILFLVKDKYLAEDIFQDVLIKIIDTIRGGRYTEEGKFLPWAMRIAHNLCVDHFRKVKRTPSIKTSDDRDIFEVIHFTEEGADTKMMKRQSHDRVQSFGMGAQAPLARRLYHDCCRRRGHQACEAGGRVRQVVRWIR